MQSENIILRTEGISKTFHTGKRYATACRGVSFNLIKGQSLGIIGESGCGKSTLAKIIVGLMPCDEGKIFYDGFDITNQSGEELRLLRKNIQCVFQDAMSSFSPKMKIKQIVCEPLYNYGLISKAGYLEKAKELLRMVELPEGYGEKYPSQLSGGERQRVNIARAMALNPEIIILDEATSALDVTIQKKIIDMLLEMQEETGTSYIFISHDLALAQSMCTNIAVMYRGSVVEMIESRNITNGKHPYTQNLLNSIFSIRSIDRKKEFEIGVADENITDNRIGCPYQHNCALKSSVCMSGYRPELKEVKGGHLVACHNT